MELTVMKTLLYVPTLHRDEETFRQESMTEKEREQFDRREELIMEYWMDVIRSVGQYLQSNGIESFDVFDEGWITPYGLQIMYDNEERFRKEMYGQPTFIAWLMKAGAKLHVTENRTAYNVAGFLTQLRMFVARVLPEDLEPKWEFAIVKPRDRAIARRMSEIVPDGGTAVLCMGLMHDVPAYLDDTWNIRVITTPKIYNIADVMLGDHRRWSKLYKDQPRAEMAASCAV